MTLIIVGILLIGYLLIATENFTGVNKAAVAIFVCTVGWVLYISYGADFVMSQHPDEYLAYLHGQAPSSIAVKEFIASNIFIKYVGRACSLVLYLLATMTIVEILNNNGCFDFLLQLMKTRNSKKLLWTLAVTTFIVSAHLDNLSTTVLMLMMMHSIVPHRRQRLVYGATIVVAAHCGGAVTVIGSPVGLLLWNNGIISATPYFLAMIVPCLLAWAIPIWWMGRSLPDRVETETIVMPYRGDDTRLNLWQRLLMLIVGIGGLWFIPTFHNITRLSPFLGALCVLGVLWVVNEIFNRKLMNMDALMGRRMPLSLLYSNYQMVLFIFGVMLALGVVKETGAVDTVWAWLQGAGANSWQMGIASGLVSTLLNDFATAASFITLNPSHELNSPYTLMVAYGAAIGSNVLGLSSVAGAALMKTERMHVGWYFKHVGLACAVGGMVGFLVLFFTVG
jgi:Na+/H+ antiporter NhaD/arsenite permease-like protein